MIKLRRFVFNLFAENTYIIWDDKTYESMIIDPGCSNSVEEKIINDFIISNNLKIKYLINTHCHIDHILGNAFIKSKYKPEFFAPEEDDFLIDLMLDQSRYFGIEMKLSPHPDEFLKESTQLSISDSSVNPIFTPGHSPGGYCLYFSSENFCITGDVLFRESIGRTDLWGGDYDTLITSIETKLLTLPESVKIFPGHGVESIIEYEKTYNPYLV